MNVDVVAVDDALEAVALRSGLEYWGCKVTLHLAATAEQLVRVLNGETELSGLVVLMCHGTEAGLAPPELAPVAAARQPFAGAISATEMREFLHVPGRVVLCTGYTLGRAPYAAAFRDAGCKSYIGPADPEGSASLLYVLLFVYELHVRGTTVAEAHRTASGYGHETRTFQVYEWPA